MNRSIFGPHRLLIALLLTAAATLFGWAPAQAGTPTMYSFGAQAGDGTSPQSPLALDSYGNLWGTTYSGGANSTGTIFEVLKGTLTPVTVYSFGPSTGTDGQNPLGGLLLVGTTLYGTTAYGGTYGYGSFYKMVPTGTTVGGTYTSLYKAFGSSSTKPENPVGTPIAGPTGDTNVYFSTVDGGADADGTVTQMSLTGTIGFFYSMYSAGADYGYNPFCTLVLGRGSSPYYIYGTALTDATYGKGEIFSLKVPFTTNNPTFAGSLLGADGSGTHGYPYGGLVQGVGADTNLYGADADFAGGTGIATGKYGELFKINTALTTYTSLYDFTNSGTPVRRHDAICPTSLELRRNSSLRHYIW